MSAYRRIRFALLCWVIIVGVACSSGYSPQLSKLPPEGVILAFGDSLTYGTGAGGPQHSYPSVVEKRIDRQVINEGVPGELSREGLLRLPRVLERHQPNLVILCHGGNDLLRKREEKQVAANLREMIELIQARDIDVVLLAVPKPTVFFMDTADFYSPIAKKYNIPIDTETLLRLEKDSALKSDQVHLNREGYRQLADAVVHLLNTSGAI